MQALIIHNVQDTYCHCIDNCPMDFKKETGRRIRRARELAGLERSDVVESTDLEYSTLANYENGYRQISPAEVLLLSRLYKCSAAWMMCLDDEDPYTPQEKALIANYRALDDQGKSMVSRIVEPEPRQSGKVSNS